MASELADKVAYLHDAYVHGINVRIDENGYRELAISVHCNPECGLDEWNDKRLTIRFLEPLEVEGRFHGNRANIEEIDSMDVGYSVPRRSCQGCVLPTVVCRIALVSGSLLRVVCEEIVIVEE